jgi:multidrug efflux system membrane fusion protein
MGGRGRLFRRLAFGAGLFAIVVFVVIHLENDAAVKSAAAPLGPLPVSLTTVAKGDVPIVLSGLGQVVAFNEVTLRPQVAGQITSVTFGQGQIVQKGALLVQIDPRPFQAKLDEDEAKLAKDEAHAVNAEANLGRYEPLAKEGFASTQQTQGQEAMVDQERAAVAADEAVVEQDKIFL